ncbi:MAG: UDP-N-acetylmuramoyl-tripeptide--D-alanyl-D-alanine ligase, partial [Bacteroidaceae bacterium]|nr:UDP-N-acetylmuramoyl-tripeptide--D-alanyl-D-alanine ligase [Bacteroidaceae bacterium]
VPAQAICEALEGYIPSNNRSQLTETADNHLIVDAYNANPTSMRAALENFRLMEVPHKVAVLGDMKELGEGSVEEHRQIVSLLTTLGLEKVILVGAEFGKVCGNFEHYPDVEAVKELFAKSKPKGKFILIKGSNSMKLFTLKEVL